MLLQDKALLVAKAWMPTALIQVTQGRKLAVHSVLQSSEGSKPIPSPAHQHSKAQTLGHCLAGFCPRDGAVST